MRKLSLMTINMVAQMYFTFQIDHDLAGFLDSYEEMMELVSEIGYDAVDISAFETEILGVERIREILEKYNLEVSSYIYFDQYAAMDEEGYEERIAKSKQAAEDAVKMKTKVLMLVPQAQDGIEEYSPEEIHAQMIRHWLPVAAYAKERGIHPVVEDTPDLRLHFCRAQDMKAVLDAVPELEVVYDSGNMFLVGEDPISFYDVFADKIAHIHLKDMRLATGTDLHTDTAADGTRMTGAPTGTGIVDLQMIVEHIKEQGYRGYLTVEFVVDADYNFRKSLKQSRDYMIALM